MQIFSGNQDAIPQYENRRNLECTAYLLERAAYYAAEQRLVEYPFWERRSTVLNNALLFEEVEATAVQRLATDSRRTLVDMRSEWAKEDRGIAHVLYTAQSLLGSRS